MRRQQKSENFFKNKKVKEEHKIVSERIKDLEQKVKDKRFKQDTQQNDF